MVEPSRELEGEPELVPGPTACQLDVWGKLVGLGIPFSLLVGAILLAAGFAGSTLAIALTALVVLAAIVSTVFMVWSGAVVKREKAAGYSTMYDFSGYALRDPKTLELLRPADEKPTGTMRRSIFRAMLTIKPGTLVAKRLEQEDKE